MTAVLSMTEKVKHQILGGVLESFKIRKRKRLRLEAREGLRLSCTSQMFRGRLSLE